MGQQRSVRIHHNACAFHSLAYRVRAGISATLLQGQETTAHRGMSSITKYNMSLAHYQVYMKCLDKLIVIQLRNFWKNNTFRFITLCISV